MKKLLILIGGFWLICPALLAQKTLVKGRVIDHYGKPLEFASLYIKNTTRGTTTNELGLFEIELSPGKYEIVFQYVGFKNNIQEIQVGDETLIVDVEMVPENFILPEITITAKDKDPAYGIIRQAQRKRRFYLREEIKSFQCQAYIKNLQRLSEKREKILGAKVEADTGIVYFSESLSELSYEQPQTYKERMISSKVSGDSRAFSFNQAADAWLNLYKNVSGEDLNERGFVSPIASNALAFYRYRLEGAFKDDTSWVYKIKLIPKRRNAPAYNGYIYIIKDSWRVHSADLYLKKGAIEFVDSISVKQVYARVEDSDVWVPISQRAQFAWKAFGFGGNGYYLIVFSNYDVNPAFPKKYFKGAQLTVEKEANKKDSIYWNQVRPVPLTLNEKIDYRKKDSIQFIKESKVYKDSVDQKNNKFAIGDLLFGYRYRDSFKKRSFSFPGLPSTLQFNTVEGLVTNFAMTYRQNYEDNRFFYIRPTFRYGFSNERFQSHLEASYVFNPITRSRIWVEGGRKVEQLSRNNVISPFLNTIYTLFNEENFAKLYEKTYAKVRYRREIFNGLLTYTSIEYAQRNPMFNTTDFSIRDVDNREFTPNQPFSRESVNTSFPKNQALTLGVLLLWSPKQEYILYPDNKFALSNKYPTLRVNYRKGLQILGSDVNYDFLALGIYDDLNFKTLGQSSYNVEVGRFFNDQQLTFVDFRHFQGNQTIIFNNALTSFQLLDYYEFSTSREYLAAHYSHHFNGLLINAIPLLRKLKWQTVVTSNYLYTEEAGHYFELGVGIEHIFKFLRTDFFMGWQEDRSLKTGIVLGFGF